MQSGHTQLKVAQLKCTGHVTRMLDERLPKTFSMENFRKESALKVAKSNPTKTPFKHRLRISTFQMSPWNRLHRIEQSGVASSTKELHSLEQRESVKQKECAKNGNQEPRDHHQTQYSQSWYALFATYSLEHKVA